VTDRYEAAEMGPDDPYPGMWGIRDTALGEWVHNSGDVERYPMEHSAQAWLAGRRYIDNWAANRTQGTT
jgi:hypothetical protein